MVKGLNKVMVIGYLGRDPELRYTTAGKPVASLSVAATTGWGENEHTEWFKVVAWGKLAEVCMQYPKKGSRVYLESYLQTRTWEGSDGKQRRPAELMAQQLVMLGRARESRAVVDEGIDLDKIPF